MAETKKDDLITYVAIKDAVIGANWYGKGTKIQRAKSENFVHQCFVEESKYIGLSSRSYFDPEAVDSEAMDRLRGMSL